MIKFTNIMMKKQKPSFIFKEKRKRFAWLTHAKKRRPDHKKQKKKKRKDSS